ncbi:MAG: spore germination protein [Eubacterium sp.]|nr:spore germination protein [Eubacterium sp.]
MDEIFHPQRNYDLVLRSFLIASRPACFYMIDGLHKDDILEKIMDSLLAVTKDAMPPTVQAFSSLIIPYGEVELLNDTDKLTTALLSGVPILIIDGYSQALAIDFRTYPTRSVEEPSKEKVLRGSRDGFVETIVFNTALIRRRIRSPGLVMEITSVGKSSHTDIVLSYMQERADPHFLENIRRRLAEISTDALTMNCESLAELLCPHHWINPFPKYKYTERPDTAAAAILEGSIVLLIDNSPSALILPTSFFELTEEANDYYLPPVTGTYLRLSRLLVNITALILTPTWLLFLQYPQWIPDALRFIAVKDEIHIPILFQLLILEFAIDGMKLAAMNTPEMLSTPLSVIAGIVLGDFASQSGWFNPETMLYMAFVAIANYAQASYELGYALKFMRMILLVTTGLFGIYGYIGGILLCIVTIAANKTLSGIGYLYPLFPFNGKELVRRLFRVSLEHAGKPK